MRKKKHPNGFGQIGKRGKHILLYALDTFEWSVDVARRPGLHLRYGTDLPEVEAYWERVEHERAIKRLKQKRWLKERKRGKKIFLELTAEGKVYALAQRIIANEVLLPKGTRCLVSFDIPEKARAARLVLRRLLKSAEFECLHQSAWLTSKDVTADMKQLIILLKIKDWVSIFVGKKV